MSTRHESPPEGIIEKGYDPRDVPARGVTYVGLGLFAGIVISGVLVAGLLALFFHLDRLPQLTGLEVTERAPPQPRLEVAPERSRIAIEQEAKNRLQDYAWIDRQAETVRIPIERAMELIAERGWQDQEGGGR